MRAMGKRMDGGGYEWWDHPQPHVGTGAGCLHCQNIGRYVANSQDTDHI